MGKRIAVLGTGANGAAIGADLALAGLDVFLIDQWPENVTAMRERGVRVEMPEQTLTVSVRAFNLCDVCTFREPFDVVLIVAADESEIAKLAALEAQAKANGVDDLLWLSGAEVRALEPALRANRALLSPSSGIVDSHALMLALRGDAEAHGAMIALATPVVSGRAHGDGVAIENGGAEPMRFTATLVVNAAGLDAQAVARAIDGLPPDKIPPLFLAKGNYFSLTVRSPFSRLVYPMPAPGDLGVHLTLDLAGHGLDRTSNGWRRSTTTSIRGAPSFYAAIRTYWPDLPDGALQPGYAGIRPMIARPGGSSTDFLIQTERDHGVRGLVNLFGIESPALRRASRSQKRSRSGFDHKAFRWSIAGTRYAFARHNRCGVFFS